MCSIHFSIHFLHALYSLTTLKALLDTNISAKTSTLPNAPSSNPVLFFLQKIYLRVRFLFIPSVAKISMGVMIFVCFIYFYIPQFPE